jgi:hypothetical protein
MVASPIRPVKMTRPIGPERRKGVECSYRRCEREPPYKLQAALRHSRDVADTAMEVGAKLGLHCLSPP